MKRSFIKMLGLIAAAITLGIIVPMEVAAQSYGEFAIHQRGTTADDGKKVDKKAQKAAEKAAEAQREAELAAQKAAEKAAEAKREAEFAAQKAAEKAAKLDAKKSREEVVVPVVDPAPVVEPASAATTTLTVHEGYAVDNNEEKSTKRPSYNHGSNDFRFGFGYYALTPAGYTLNSEWNPVLWNSLYDGVMYMPADWYTFNLDYGYWVKDWLYVGMSLIWSGGFSKGINRDNEYQQVTFNYNCMTALPMVRFAWLRRQNVQFYSAVGVGYNYAIYETNSGRRDTEHALAYDATLIGMSVGRKFFGYLELGIGSRGIGRAGIGYRF